MDLFMVATRGNFKRVGGLYLRATRNGLVCGLLYCFTTIYVNKGLFNFIRRNFGVTTQGKGRVTHIFKECYNASFFTS